MSNKAATRYAVFCQQFFGADRAVRTLIRADWPRCSHTRESTIRTASAHNPWPETGSVRSRYHEVTKGTKSIRIDLTLPTMEGVR